MPASFPGVDPFVEASGDWPDFHSTFMNVWREAISDRLPADYVARLDERLTLVEYEEEEERQRVAPDVVISRDRSAIQGGRQATAILDEATPEPTMIRVKIKEEERQTFVQIVRHSDRKLIAVLELLSPSNKAAGQTQYLAKRQAVLASDAHLVELDLLIGGKRLPMQSPLPPGHFHYIVSRAERRPDCEVYSWSLPSRMPILPVPLAVTDPDIKINLAEVLALTYQRGRYEKTVNYNAPLNLPLAEQELQWVRQWIA
jgi:hypothetical protein